MASYINISLKIETFGHCAPNVNIALNNTVDLDIMAEYVNSSLKSTVDLGLYHHTLIFP